MVRKILIYVEGGGSRNPGREKLRIGLGRFLERGLTGLGRHKQRPRVIPCGSREKACEDFLRATRAFPEALCILLVDGERPVSAAAREHLQQLDGWDLRVIDEGQCHLMVQVMEAWMIADPEALRAYYGHEFRAGALPPADNVEDIPKDKVYAALKRATRANKKGEYHKTEHGPDLLARLDPGRVCQRAPHCRALFDALAKQMDAPA